MNRVAAISLFGLGFFAAFWLQALHYEERLASKDVEHAAYMLSVTQATSEAIQAQMNEIQRQQLVIAAIDHRYTQELSHAQAESDRLRAAVRSSERRLYIQTTNPASCSGVPEASTTTSVDHAASRAELDPRAAERIIALTERGDRAIRQLTACQAYIRGVIE